MTYNYPNRITIAKSGNENPKINAQNKIVFKREGNATATASSSPNR